MKNNLPSYAPSIVPDEQILDKVSQYMADNNISFDFAINRILCRFLKVKNHMELSECIRYGYSEDETCERLFISPEVVQTAKEKMERMKALNLSEEDLKTFYKSIDKLAQF